MASYLGSTLREEVRRYLISCEKVLIAVSSPRLFTEEEGEYVQASEVLLKIDDLTDAEMEAVKGMLSRLSENLNSERNGKL